MKIAIIGAAYTGMEAARYLKNKRHTISVTTTGGEPINWAGHGTGPKTLSNQKIKDAGFVFLDPVVEHDGEGLL